MGLEAPRKGLERKRPMERRASVDVKAYRAAMQAEFERAMDAVAEAVNDAADGQWISGSEEKVREVMAEFRAKAYQQALQMRVEAREGDFSPGGAGDGKAAARQGAK